MLTRAALSRLLVVLALLPAACLGLIGLLRDTPAPRASVRRQPLDFKLVEARYNLVRLFDSREAAEGQLGPPTQRNIWEPEFRRWQELAEHSNRHFRVPGRRVWDRWADPKDRSRWVTVLFAGDQVYFITKQGF